MPRSSAYSFKNVAATLNGQAVIGFWDGDDAVSVAPLSDVGAMLVGADGSSIFSQSANEGATITLRLQHTSPAHRLLHQIWARQRARGVRVTGFPFSFIDADSGEGGSTAEAFIQAAPSDAKGVNAGPREWVLVTGQWRPEIPRP
jgi:hypothetical protein